MLISTDRPINNVDEDLLGRASFSRHLGEAIYNYKGKDSLVVAIYGKWGTGKTSVANMALQKIEELAVNDERKPIIIRFAPWNYSDKDNLIGQFFSSLKAKIDSESTKEFKKIIGKALRDYSDIFEFASLIPVVGGPLASLLKNNLKAKGKELAKPVDLDTIKNRLENALQEADQKIVILVDDIDRLSNSQIRDIFQLVKQVGDLPNIVYLLAMEREIVCRALAEVHSTDGNEYLEKIVQIPFEIPEINKTKLYETFFVKLKAEIDELSCNTQLNQPYWDRVFENCISPYLHTLRDVNRIINTFQFKYSILYEETSLEDMLALTTLEVMEPSLYKWIAENKDAVCGGAMHSFMSNYKESGEYKRQYEEDFRRLGLDPEKAKRNIATIFPVFADDIGFQFYEVIPINARQDMRAAQPERFDLYFMFNMEMVKVPRSVVNSCVFSLGEKELKQRLLDINNEGNIIYCLGEIKSMINSIPNDRLIILSSVLLDIASIIEGETSGVIFATSPSEMARYYAELLIARVENQKDRYDILHKAVQAAGKKSLGSIAQVIRRIERVFDQVADGAKREEDQIVSTDQLDGLEKLFLNKVKEPEMIDNMIETEDFLYTYSLWEELDKGSANNYLRNGFKDIVFKLKFLCKFANRWNGSKGAGWSYNQTNYMDYFIDDEMYKIILDLDKSILDQFTENDQVKLASFVLNFKKEPMDFENEQAAKLLLEEWKNR